MILLVFVCSIPYLNDAVLRATGDDIVVVWAPRDVEDRALVPANKRMVSRDAANLE